MSRYFVDDAPVAIPEWDDGDGVISDRPPNVIYIKSKMDVATKGKVTSELFTVGNDQKLEARLGANETALLIYNIVRWAGPDFDGVPCTRESIMRLDPTEPHIAKVLEVIAERNKSPKAREGSATPGTSTSAGATGSITPPNQDGPESVSLQLATGTRRLTLRSALDGHRSKLDD